MGLTAAPATSRRLQSGLSVLTSAMAKNSRFFVAKSMIIEEGNEPIHIFRVVSGRALQRRMLIDGRSQLTTLLLPGDMIGVHSLFGGVKTDSIEAVTDVVVQWISYSEVHSLANQEINVAFWLISYVCQESQKLERRLAVLANGTAAEKIAFTLLDLWRRIRKADNGPVRLPISQRELAEHVGLTLPHVCRTVAAFRKSGAIEVHYGSIEILKAELLV